MKFIGVYFSPKQISNPETSSPSPRKPVLVVADWAEQGFRPRQLIFMALRTELLLWAETGRQQVGLAFSMPNAQQLAP